MTEGKIRELLTSVSKGGLSVEEAMKSLRHLPYEDMGFAKIDHHRHIRTGFPEVVFCEGKTLEHIERITKKIISSGSDFLATRISDEAAEQIVRVFPNVTHHADARCVSLRQNEKPESNGEILVVCAGTSDIPVAEEAVVTAEIMGSTVKRLYDVGVAGIHRLLMDAESLYAATVIVVVAGMEGALASVVGGLVDKPVVAVPTSIGYGASFGGLSALLTMLNSCATGIGVVNIDNGFGGGYLAHNINSLRGCKE